MFSLRSFILMLALTCPAIHARAADAGDAGIDPAGIEGSLIICGGGALDDSIIERFIELAGGEEAKLVIIPTASSRADQVDAETLLEPWRVHHPKRLDLLHTRDPQRADHPQLVAPLKSATAVWISGGSQSKLAEAYLDTAVEEQLHALLRRGGVIGGTSAGAAIMSRTMIASGGQTPVMKTGLGFLPAAIIDQHFLVRRRQTRSLKALADHPGHFGLGIDERTAVEVRGRRLRVLGESVVTVMLAASVDLPERIISLKKDQRADLTALRRAAADRASALASGRPFPDKVRHTPVVPSGTLLIVGGGKVTDEIADQFVQLAGGSNAKIVVLPTAAPDAAARRTGVPSFLKDREVISARVLPHRSGKELRSAEFAAALEEATGVWFGGGRQWRFIDAYEGTPAIERFHEVLRRGGVIGGSSAGASIQAEYMVRGHPLGNDVMMAEGYQRGLNFLPGVAIDQHFTQRERMEDLKTVVAQFPQLLGIGIDESTALIVRHSRAAVIGAGNVYFLDASSPSRDGLPLREGEQLLRLSAGGVYDLKARASVTPAQPPE